VSIGRRPFTEGLSLDKAGVKLDEKGRVVVDDQVREKRRKEKRRETNEMKRDREERF
jgi:hypothetical protein